MRKKTAHARSRARRNAVQALYQWQLNRAAIETIMAEFETDRTELQRADKAYFKVLVLGSVNHAAELEQALRSHLDREINQLDPVERAILTLGAYELTYQTDLSIPVIINESVELAKLFGAAESYKYVNGVLDKLANVVR